MDKLSLILNEVAVYEAAYKALYEDSIRISYDEFDIKKKDIVKHCVEKLLAEITMDELRPIWFVDYGTMNGWDWKTSFKFAVANALHEIDKQNFPERHKPLPQKYNWNCWHEDNCSCGLCSSCDSSD